MVKKMSHVINTWTFIVFIGELFLTNADSEKSNFIISSRSNLKVYWNIPTFQCRSFKFDFSEIAEKYGIIHNEKDDFRGDQIAILYDPGYFPAIITDGTDGKVELRNKGIPQDGDLQLHLELLENSLRELVPNETFSGLGIIDFERWRPIFRQNFGTLSPYKALSIEREKLIHPFWPAKFLEKEAKRKFEFHGRTFMEKSLELIKELRPLAKWGYYAYPYCFNKSPSNPNKECPPEVQQENDRLNWLFSGSNLLLPSVYLGEKSSMKDKLELIEGRINEARRVASFSRQKNTNISVVPYFWYKYHDSRNFLTKGDLKSSLSLLSNLKIDGLIIWGSSEDVNTKSKCVNMFNYLNDILGPILINLI